MIKFNLIYNYDYEDCGYRLSATSKAFCEAHNTGSEWYEFTPVFDYEKMATIKDKNGDILITSPFRFINPLYIKFSFDYSSLKKAWEEIIKEAPAEYKGLKVIVKDFPSEEELKSKIIDYFKNKYTKLVKIIDNGSIFAVFRTPKTQNFPFEKAEGIDNFKEFEEFVKNFYNLKDVSLTYPEGSENSPIYYWGDEVKDYIVKVDEFTFIKKDFLERKEEEEKEKALNSAKKILNAILSADSIDELDWRYTPSGAKKIINDWGFDKLIPLLEKAEKYYQHLQDKEIENKLKNYVKEAENFLNELYTIGVEMPEAPSRSIIVPDYYYSHKKEAQKAKEELINKFGEIYKKANSLYQKIKNDIELISSKAGFFYINKNDKVWNVKVPNDKKGLFIGKAGTNIKALAKKYKVKINII